MRLGSKDFPSGVILQRHIDPHPAQQGIRMIAVGEAVNILNTQQTKEIRQSDGSLHIRHGTVPERSLRNVE